MEPHEVKIKQEIFFEWIFRVGNELHWHLCSRLMTEKQAKEWFGAENGMGREINYCQYKKTDRAFSVDVDNDSKSNSEIGYKVAGYESDGRE